MNSVKESKFLILFPAKYNGCAGMGFADTAQGPGASVQWSTWICVGVHPYPGKIYIYRWDLSMCLSKYIQALTDRVGTWTHPELTNCEATDAHRSRRNTQARCTEGGVTSWHFTAIKKLGFGRALYFTFSQYNIKCHASCASYCKNPSVSFEAKILLITKDFLRSECEPRTAMKCRT